MYREILGLSKEGDGPEYVVQAHHAGGSQMVAEGRPRLALSHIDQLLASYRMDLHGNLALVYGAHDPGCCSLGMRALSLLMLGYLEQAQAASARALDLSERLGHKPSIAHTHLFRAELCIILDRPEEAAAHLGTSISLSKKYRRRLRMRRFEVGGSGGARDIARAGNPKLLCLADSSVRRTPRPVACLAGQRGQLCRGRPCRLALEAAATTGSVCYEAGGSRQAR